MQYQWIFKEKIPQAEQRKLSRELGIGTSLATLLLQRGLNSFNKAQAFFCPSLADLHDPFLMKDMDVAVQRLHTALEEDQGILVYGDYDVDGTTSVALLSSFLNDLGYENHEFYIPDRYKEGYGLSKAGIDHAKVKGLGLIVALDCGIKAVELARYAKDQGLDLIICDHHRPGAELPPAVAILDPKRDDCEYPYKELSGCGIGLKLIQAWSKHTGFDWNIENYLDLCAISIACDIVPMNGENRILSFYGLKEININPRPGIKAILERLGKNTVLENEDLVFLIGPRINAAGRIKHASYAAKLLLGTDQKELEDLIDRIESYNSERREKDRETTEHALSMIGEDAFLSSSKSTVLYHQNWNKGVVGIVASRLIEKHYRPTIVLTESEGKLSGSARSVHDFDVYEAIDACSDELLQFGGHKYAAGLTMEKDRFDQFREKFEAEVSARLREDQHQPVLEIDLELEPEDLNQKFYNQVNRMTPFGPANMRPVFVMRELRDDGSRIVGSDRKHLKTSLISESDPTKVIKGIAFGMADKEDLLKSGERVDVAFSLSINEWRGKRSVEMMIKDIRPSN